METIANAPASAKSTTTQKSALSKVLPLLFFPIGLYTIWKRPFPLWARLLYTLLGLPLLLFLTLFIAVVTCAFFLPPLDLTIGDRLDRTIYNKAGNYGVTFLKTGDETKGAYELIRVEIEPQGGNDWHYHKTFDEQFTVEEGKMTVGLEGREIPLEKGQSTTAHKGNMHFFKNLTQEKSVLLVKTVPARGLEKTLRVSYGLTNDGLTNADGIPHNFWQLALLLGYSESYLQGVPGFIQEPLIKSISRIAQWKGEDKVLKKYFH